MLTLSKAMLLACASALVLGLGSPSQAAFKPEHKGGTLKLTASAAAGTLDPMINYEVKFWQLYAFTYDGLVTFKKVDGKESNVVVPDLAEAMPAISDGGKTYTFKLRTGIKFSNGQDLTTETSSLPSSGSSRSRTPMPARGSTASSGRCLPEGDRQLLHIAARGRR